MSTSVDVYALPKLPSTATRGPTRICSCMLALLLVLVLVALAPSVVISLSGDGVSMTVPTVVTSEAPLPVAIPKAVQRVARMHAKLQASGATDTNGLEFQSALLYDTGYWHELGGLPDQPQAQLNADMMRTLGWLVEQARAPR